MLCYQIHQWCKIIDTSQIYNKKQGRRILWKGLANVQTPDIFLFLSFQSEWSAATFFIPNPALLVAVSSQKQSLFPVCFWYLEILIFFFSS